MKKILISIIVLLILFGCNKQNADIKNPDDTNDTIEYIWEIPEYKTVSYDEYYANEKTLPNNDAFNIKGHNELEVGYYGIENAGIYLTLEKLIPDNNSGGYLLEKEFVDKQYFITDIDTYKYRSINLSDGYWFYFQKSTGHGDALVRINYLGEEELLLENFDIDDVDNICLADHDLIYIFKHDSFNQDYNIKLYIIYANGDKVEVINTEFISDNSSIKPEFIQQESNYHILYTYIDPDYQKQKEYLDSNPNVLNKLLTKYNQELKESSPATDQYNERVIRAIMEREYGLYLFANYDYNVLTKETVITTIKTPTTFPSDDPYNPAK